MEFVNTYLRNIEKNLKFRNATEHTHRAALQNFVELLDDDITAINEPSRTKCGAPDYILYQSDNPVGYIEAKDIGTSLDNVEETEQLERYFNSLDNLILTNYIEFRWYVQGDKRMTCKLGRLTKDEKIKVDSSGVKDVLNLFKSFLSFEEPNVHDSEELASRMASYAKLIKEVIINVFNSENKDPGMGSLHQQLEGFREVLLNELNPSEFADMYAQTICYGLFAARFNHNSKESFTRQNAAFNIPKTNPFLRKMFQHIAGPDLDERISWLVDDISKMFDRVNMSEILENFGKSTQQQDPVLHFYETFLTSYDKGLREVRGVYYTPEPVVSYIVESVDYVLSQHFNLEEGLADSSKIRVADIDRREKDERKTKDVHRVQIFDPATGTGTFLHGVINHIHKKFEGNEGLWSGYVSEHLLPRLYGFELLMAPYAVAHMKLGLLLSTLGYKFDSNERLRVYLTNALEEPHEITGLNLFTHWLAEESNAASEVKTHSPVMVILGNPPYSVSSENNGEWISGLLRGKDTYTEKSLEQNENDEKLLANYLKVDGKSLSEANPKNLNDDYVKFIRLSQWRIERTGYGVMAFITNHGYLENPTFRGMRQSLMETFDDIYILDLHGSSLKKETPPDNMTDYNVFDIRPGVAICLLIKRHRSRKKTNVYHADLWGDRKVKYDWLSENDISKTEWKKLDVKEPYYLFAPYDNSIGAEYQQGISLKEIMPNNSTGIKTHRDHLVFDYSVNELEDKISDFTDLNNYDEDIRLKYFGNTSRGNNLPGDNSEWKMSEKRRTVANDDRWMEKISTCSYRPFDNRPIIYHNDLIDRPKRNIMSHILDKDNLALVTCRQISTNYWSHALVTRSIAECCLLSNKTKETGYVFPLYIYPTQSEIDSGLYRESDKKLNLSSEFMMKFENILGSSIDVGSIGEGETLKPESVISYMYAILHSSSYRERYSPFLKIDYPRIPIPNNKSFILEMSKLGDKLINLSLMEDKEKSEIKYPVSGENIIVKNKVKYIKDEDAERGKIFINENQYFDYINEEVWNYEIGSYKVLDKWLKERDGRMLTYTELNYFQSVVSNLKRIIKIQGEIDETVEQAGGWQEIFR